MLAPISHPFPPPGYGPWERVCHDLTEGLVELGHEVVVFAPAGSESSALLAATVPSSLAEAAGSPAESDARIWETLHIGKAMAGAVDRGVDIVHSHLHVHALGYGPLLPVPLLSTLHGAAWHRPHRPILDAYRHQPFVSLSNAERRMAPELNYVATVANGIRTGDYLPRFGTEGELAFVGRMAPEKAPDLAIEAARLAGRPLTLAGSVEPRYRGFFEARIRPALGREVTYAGELTRLEVADLLAASAALLMPLRWEEPFGLVVVESLATATPVIAWRRGAMPELIDDSETGFLVDTAEEAAAAVRRIPELDRHRCREVAEERYDYLTMARSYVAAYEAAIDQMRAASTSDSGAVPTPILVSDSPYGTTSVPAWTRPPQE